MGKSKNPGEPGSGNLGRGIAAYRHILKGPQAADESAKAEAPAGLKTSTGAHDPAAKPPAAKDGEVPVLERVPAAMAQGLRKLTRKPADGEERESKYRRVAKFLILIGGDEAAKILSSLEEDQVEAISKEIASIRGITAEEAEGIFAEFRSLLEISYGYSGASAGGVGAARRLLYAAYGPEKGEALLRKTVPETRENPLDFLEDFSGEQIALLLREEQAAAAALVLSRLSPKLSAAVLANTAPVRKLEIVKRIARLGQTSPEVLEQVAGALREKARHLSAANGGDGEPVDGMNALAAILKHSDYSFGDRLLKELADEAPDLGQDLKERLHTLDDVIQAEDKPIQEKLGTMEDRDIALLLKGRSPEFAQKILSNVSANRRSLIREEGDMMGAVPRRDVDTAAQEFLTWFRLNREAGRILLLTDEDIIV